MRKIVHLFTIVALLFDFYFAFTFKETRNGMLMIGEKQGLLDIKKEHNGTYRQVHKQPKWPKCSPA
ncbi:hypothetical protein PAJ34TS1_31870 [Paenibacillus azoreducens]|uniref:Uncharacterized protein n=1 Tax=Paenibacillus azoreducens TaxID=116718 RepID=A0A919YJR5_9BACL|nr:hypothetical protein J34TS1_53780 [Paenibacillus azoreducens]